MSTSMENFPLALVSDGLISYIQYLFSSKKHTPSEYRWNSNDRESRITISGPFIINNERHNSAPYIIVERGGFMVDNRVIDNLRSAKENTFENPESVMLTNGAISITVGTQSASEASSIANYLMIQLQGDRHGIMDTLGFIRNFQVTTVSSEEPVFKDSEVRRWKVVISLTVSIQMGWVKLTEGTTWEKFEVISLDTDNSYDSVTGLVMSGGSNVSDSNASFGFTNDNEPQLLRREFDDGMYYVMFDDDKTRTFYNVVDIVDEHTLTLEKDGKPFKSNMSKSGVKYKLLWNDTHLHVRI